MIYIQGSLENWIKRFPSLKAALTQPCDNCGRSGEGMSPYIEKDYAGIEIKCPCGAPSVFISVPTSYKLIKFYRDALDSLAGTPNPE